MKKDDPDHGARRAAIGRWIAALAARERSDVIALGGAVRSAAPPPYQVVDGHRRHRWGCAGPCGEPCINGPRDRSGDQQCRGSSARTGKVPSDMDFDGFRRTLEVNTIAPMRVVQTFLPN